MPTTPSIPYRVRGLSSTAGSGNITISAANAQLYKTFPSYFGTGTSAIGYIIVGPDSNKFFEVGFNNYNGTTNVLTRDADNKILASSNGGARVNIPASVTYDVLALDVGQHYVRLFSAALVMDQMDHGGTFVFNGASSVNATLCPLNRTGSGCTYVFKNDGTASFNINPFAGDAIASVTPPYVVPPGDGVIVYRGPSTWHFLPFKSSANVFYWNGTSLIGRTNLTIWYSATAPASVPDGDLWIQP